MTVVGAPTVRTEQHGNVTRVWLDLPGQTEWHVPFDDPRAVGFAEDVVELLGPADARTVWLYTPMGLELARALEPALLVYDVMDDLAAFAKAAPDMRERHEDALRSADVVFAGGRSLHRAVTALRPDAHLFPSGVEPEHFAQARPLRQPRDRPAAGYVGVIDERLDLELIGELATLLPDWQIELIGPVIEKIDRESVPRAPNLVYHGKQPYERLPELMAGLDVALMPFALNDATRSISPTKTLEYLAAGLPVVSTRVPDVVADYRGVVALEDDADGFADACREAVRGRAADREAKVRPLLHAHHWDTIAARMQDLMYEQMSYLDSPARAAGAIS